MTQMHQTSVDLGDIDISDIDIEGLEVVAVADGVAMPELGASVSTCSCGSSSTCCSCYSCYDLPSSSPELAPESI